MSLTSVTDLQALWHIGHSAFMDSDHMIGLVSGGLSGCFIAVFYRT